MKLAELETSWVAYRWKKENFRNVGFTVIVPFRTSCGDFSSNSSMRGLSQFSWGCAPYVRGEPKSKLVPESHIREHFEGSAELLIIEDFERVGQGFETCMQTYIAYLVILLFCLFSLVLLHHYRHLSWSIRHHQFSIQWGSQLNTGETHFAVYHDVINGVIGHWSQCGKKLFVFIVFIRQKTVSRERKCYGMTLFIGCY